MGRKLLLGLAPAFAFLALMPAAHADISMGFIQAFYGINATLLLIPVMLIEAAIAYFMTKKWLGLNPGFGLLLFLFLMANLFSSAIGYYVFSIAELLASDVADVAEMMVSPIMLGPAYLLTVLLEGMPIYAALHGKSKNLLKDTVKISIVVNAASYVLIVAVVYLGFTIGF